MKNNTPKLIIVLLSLSFAACNGVSRPTTADSTTLYAGPVTRRDSLAMKDTTAKDSLKMGPDNFGAKDTSTHKARGR